MKMIFTVMASLCLATVCHAQSITALKLGDRFPDMTFTNIINSPFSSVPYHDLKDKVVVLDFFATWCSSCLNLFPHLDSLKAEFGDKLEIFVVTGESRTKVEKMFKTSPVAKGFKLPFIVEDTVLNKFFPNRFIPHEVLLKGGNVAAITYPEFINDKTIEILLRGEVLALPVKLDVAYNRNKSLYENHIGTPLDLTLRKFLITKHIDGLGGVGSWSISADSLIRRVTSINIGLLNFILSAANMDDKRNRVVLKVRDSSRFLKIGASGYTWVKENTYSIEYCVPVKWNREKVNDWLLKQLNLCLDYEIYKSDELVDCWVLSSLGDKRANHFNNALGKNDNKIKTYKNLTDLIDALNSQIPGRPFVPIVVNEVKETAINNISLKVTDIHNLLAVSNALKPYGLTLRPAKRKLSMLIIEDKLN